MSRTSLSFSSSSTSSFEESEPSFYSSNSSSGKTEFPPVNVDPSTSALIQFIEQLKAELTVLKEAKIQLATLYKVSFRSRNEKQQHSIFFSKVKCKSDLNKSAQISKLRLQLESELNRFCTIDQKDFVAYLQRQLLQRDQRIAEQTYQLEQYRCARKSPSGKKIESIQILQDHRATTTSDVSVLPLRAAFSSQLDHSLRSSPCACLRSFSNESDSLLLSSRYSSVLLHRLASSDCFARLSSFDQSTRKRKVSSLELELELEPFNARANGRLGRW